MFFLLNFTFIYFLLTSIVLYIAKAKYETNVEIAAAYNPMNLINAKCTLILIIAEIIAVLAIDFVSFLAT